jgi:predicted ATPase/DNA-binding SARP family transcriptional activator
MPTTFDVLLLGPIEVRSAGQALPLGGPLARALLARLALEAGAVVPLERLVEDLWEDAARPASAAHAVRVYASKLRRLLGGGVAARAGGYALVLDERAVDVRRFEHLVDEGRDASAGGDPATASARLAEALALWRGRPLADVGYAEWAQGEIARLHELRAWAVEARVGADLRLGRHGALVPELERLVDEDPLRERLRLQLMLALYRSGRQADALAAYRDARTTLDTELGLEPSRELRELEAAILRQDASLQVEPDEIRTRRRLPAPRTPLIGRRTEVEEVAALLRGPARLVTVTGPGGIGKTRVALQAAHDLAADFADGVVFVDLAAVRDPELFADAVAAALELDEEPGRSRLDMLRGHLRRRSVALVLDNFEHVDEAAPVVASLLDAGEGVAALATSRSALRLYGEQVYELAPLELDDEAVPLFTARAEAVTRSFRANGRIAEICARLDCNALAIELAAARVPDVPLDAMLASLPRLELAAEGPRDLPHRQQTLRAAIAWSHDLLDDAHRRTFARMCVLVGWSAADASAVAEATPDELDALVARNLVREHGGRFAMLETIREHAAERLGARGESSTLHRRHAEHFLTVAEDADRALGEGREQAEWLERLEVDHANFRAALAWALDEQDAELALRLCVGLGRFWEWRGHTREGGRWTAAALALDGAPGETRMRALLRASVFAHLQGDHAGATALGEELLDAATAAANTRFVGNALRKLATIAKDAGEFERAAQLHEQALALAREQGDELGISSSLINLTDLALVQEDHERAVALGRESAELARRIGDPMRESVSLLNLGLAALDAGDPAEPAGALGRAAELAGDLRAPDSLAVALEGLAALAAGRGDHTRALLLVGAAERLCEESGYVREAAERRVHDQTVAAARSVLGDEELTEALAAGAALSFDQAVAAARDAAR